MFNIIFSDGAVIQCEEPISCAELLKKYGPKGGPDVCACHVNHYLRSLDWIVKTDAEIEWVDLSSSEGMNVYQTSLGFLLTIAVQKLMGRSIRVNNSLSEATFWELVPPDGSSVAARDEEISQETVDMLKAEIVRMIEQDVPIKSEVAAVDSARAYFNSHGRPGRARLLELAMSEEPVVFFVCEGVKDMFVTPLVPSAGYLKKFELTKAAHGVTLRFPTTNSPKELPPYSLSDKSLRVVMEYAEWMRMVKADSMVRIWDSVSKDGGKELILVSEALHAEQITRITMDFLSRPDRRIITIAGPSASGKTTTSHKLRIQLQVRGKNPIALSLDDYFVDRVKCPVDEDGNYDFEALEAIDLEFLDTQLNALLAGKKVRVPRFDFYSGKSMKGKELKLGKDDVLIIEGLHGLNDRIVNMVPRESRYGVFLSPMTGINIDKHNRIGTTEVRLLRRLVRDFRTRGNSPEDTLLRWPSVVRGAMKYIFPYQENSDAMFNSSLLYELPAMKLYAEMLLRSIDEASPVHGEAMRLVRMLRNVPVIDINQIPSNSLMREFIGGSIIDI